MRQVADGDDWDRNLHLAPSSQIRPAAHRQGQFLPPHGAPGPTRLLTVVSGTLSWGDGNKIDPAAERTFGPGSVIIVPAQGGEHWAAARQDDVKRGFVWQARTAVLIVGLTRLYMVARRSSSCSGRRTHPGARRRRLDVAIRHRRRSDARTGRRRM